MKWILKLDIKGVYENKENIKLSEMDKYIFEKCWESAYNSALHKGYGAYCFLIKKE